MNKESTIEFLNKVIFHLGILKRIASDTNNQRLVDEIYVPHGEANVLRERLFSELEEQQ